MGAPEMDLSIDSGHHGGWRVISVGGEIDLYTAPALREALIAEVEAGAERLAVDLRQVGFMDSMGLGVLIGTRRRLNERDAAFALICQEGAVRRVLDVSGMTKVFDVVDRLEELPPAETE
jgi:anti-sigma B factor antagonist